MHKCIKSVAPNTKKADTTSIVSACLFLSVLINKKHQRYCFNFLSVPTEVPVNC